MAQPAPSQVIVRVVDSDRKAVKDVELSAFLPDGKDTPIDHADGQFVLRDVPAGALTLEARADGFLPQRLTAAVRDPVHQVVLGLPRSGELSYRLGDSRLAFVPDQSAVLVRARGPEAGRRLLEVLRESGATVRPAPGRRQAAIDQTNDIYSLLPGISDQAAVIVEAKPEGLDAAAKQLRESKIDVSIVRLIQHGNQKPLGLSTDAVARFAPGLERHQVDQLVAKHGFDVVRAVPHAHNAFLLRRPGEADYDVLSAIDALGAERGVIYAEPDFVVFLETHQYIPNDPLWPSVPHLHLIGCDGAWDRLDNVSVPLRGGSPTVTIAVIDPGGVAPNHPDLAVALTDGTPKLVSNYNFVAAPPVVQTVADLADDHGTQCAGAATAAFDNMRGIPGVAPNCHLIGARIPADPEFSLMASVFLWCAGLPTGATGFPTLPTQPADVISAAFAPDGIGSDGLPDIIRDCFDSLTTYGRGGRGCVVCFSISNTGYFDFTDPGNAVKFRPFPTYARTIAVGASINVNPTTPVPDSIWPVPGHGSANIPAQVDQRTFYSPYGSALLRKPDLVAPSHTAYRVSRALVDPIVSCVRVGTGNLDGNDYRASFGGTSHSCAIVAGVAALILSARPSLSWIEVRDILHSTAARIDPANGSPEGFWQDLDGDGVAEFSRWYGFGRVDADAAVAQALDSNLWLADAYVRENLGDIGNVPSPGWHAESPDIWVRNAADPIPTTLAWNTAPPHQNPLRGQDNYVFCRVRNRGRKTAEVIYLRAMITHFPGFEFRYPQEFQPTMTASSPLEPGTYLIGEQRIEGLAQNADVIVRMTWPQALIPPATVQVGSVPVQWHPCLLLEASPHDGPTPAQGVIAVRADNNIAQRNIHIDDVGGSEDFIGMIIGTHAEAGVERLVIDASPLEGEVRLRLRLADDKLTQHLAGAADGARKSGLASMIVERVKHQGAYAVELREFKGRIEIPVQLAAGQLVPLLVASVGSASGELWLTQRRGDGALSGGYTIRCKRA